MKFLIIFLFSVNCFASRKCWVISEANADGCFQTRQTGGHKHPQAIARCPVHQGKVISNGCVISTEMVEVDDLETPRTQVLEKEESCVDQECEDLMLDKNFCKKDEQKFTGDRDGDEQTEVWCVSLGPMPTKQVTVYKYDKEKAKKIKDQEQSIKRKRDSKKVDKRDRRKRLRDYCDSQTGIEKDKCELLLGGLK